jgi:hypothetical protein
LFIPWLGLSRYGLPEVANGQGKSFFPSLLPVMDAEPAALVQKGPSPTEPVADFSVQ